MKIGLNVENDDVIISDDKSRRILVCGKTGSGKSYTMGVIIEELAEIGNEVLLVVDPQGIFWTMVNPNNKQDSELWKWNLNPRGYSVNLMVPGDPKVRYGDPEIVEKLDQMGISVKSMRINPSDLSNEMWCDLFNLDISDLMGACLYKAVKKARSKVGKDFLILDIMKEVENQKTHEKTIEAVLRKLDIASEWDIFETIHYREIEELLDPHSINVLDLQAVEQSRYGLRNLVVAVLTKFIFRQRSIARRKEALNIGSQMKKVWLAIDEAHNFCPSGKSTLSKEILIRWAKEGRQPGLSLMVTSQQPSSIDKEILSQCDIRIIHKLTNRDDIRSIDALSEDYIGKDIQYYIKQLSHVGEAVIIDDKKESIEIVRIRPRMSEHGGWGA